MLSLFFLGLAFIGMVVYFWRNRSAKSSAGNRYSRKMPVLEAEKLPTETEISKQLYADDESHDEALGITRIKTETPIKAEPAPQTNTEAAPSPKSDHLVVVYLMAKEGDVYTGYELLQALLSAGLRFGKQRIFHRHSHKDGRGETLFHCASATEPGTFDLTKMGSFSSKGLCLFFSASNVEDPLAAFDCLLETLDQLVEDLGGQVLDEKRVLFTREKMISHRQQLRAVTNSKTTADMFAQ